MKKNENDYKFSHLLIEIGKYASKNSITPPQMDYMRKLDGLTIKVSRTKLWKMSKKQASLIIGTLLDDKTVLITHRATSKEIRKIKLLNLYN